MAFANGGSIVTNGLVLALDAGDRNSYPGSGTTWTDLSGNGNTGTLTNGPTFSSANGGAIVFDGTDDFAPISTTGFPFGSSAGSLSAWAITNVTDGNYRWIVAYGSPNSGQARFLGIISTTFIFGGYGGSPDITASGVPLNIWFNIVGVYTGTDALMYLNGVLISGPTAKTWNTVASVARIGRQVNAFAEYWSGRIANVQVYNRALSASEVLQNYNAQKSRFGL